jgi:hypothetical protein
MPQVKVATPYFFLDQTALAIDLLVFIAAGFFCSLAFSRAKRK